MASIKQAFDLSGKTALITGGSCGIGLQIAEALGEQGASIVLSSRRAEELEKAQQHLSAMAIKADWIAADGQKAEDVERLARDAMSKHVAISCSTTPFIEFGKRMRPAARRSWASIHRFRTERSTRID
jgi:short-subunit dehydrogenase